MLYLQEIRDNKNNPQQLEALFQAACGRRETGRFSADLNACYSDEPDNLLLQAWYYRLQSTIEEPRRWEGISANWKLAIPLAILNGLTLWALSAPGLTFIHEMPWLALLAAPITAGFVIAFLALTTRWNYQRSLAVSIALALIVTAAILFTYLVAIRTSMDYQILAALHLALLAWAGVGVALVGWVSDNDNRFAFLMKSLEVFIVGGVYLIAGMIFGGITLGMFEALSIELPEVMMRLIAAGGAGLLPVIAVVTIYDPFAEPKNQDFTQGLSKFIGTMMRLLLPLTLGVLVVYIFVIPFNFFQPFKNRDLLIIYNAMLFAIVGLLVGATPINLGEISPRLGSALRSGIIAVSGLATLVSLYSLSAIIYRTVTGAITINRLTMMGWNVINITLLVLILIRLLGSSAQPWNERIKAVFSLGAVFYVSWSLFVILVMPLIFR
ncbi:MAG: hypothetical protein EHM41_07545 [Chloroflexi bacterium]|nr:MAG: hypothetical protein EHM41_07545 [Chloroflexota bacterium]